VTYSEPLVFSISLVAVGLTGGGTVTDLEQLAEHFHCVALLPFAKQCSNRNLKELAQQVEQGGFHCGHGMKSDAKVEGLQTAPSVLYILYNTRAAL